MAKRSPMQRQQDLREVASRHFLRAAAALTEWTREGDGFALIEAGRGLFALAEADSDLRTHDEVLAYLKEQSA